MNTCCGFDSFSRFAFRTGAAIALWSLALCAVAGACELGVSAKLLRGPEVVDSYGSAPLPIVATGTNAPEALIHVGSASAVIGGRQRLHVYAGPCRSRLFSRDVLSVRSTEMVRKGDLFFVVPQGYYTATQFVQTGSGWALRRATPQEERSYQTCRW